jgi:hypothetical protein
MSAELWRAARPENPLQVVENAQFAPGIAPASMAAADPDEERGASSQGPPEASPGMEIQPPLDPRVALRAARDGGSHERELGLGGRPENPLQGIENVQSAPGIGAASMAAADQTRNPARHRERPSYPSPGMDIQRSSSALRSSGSPRRPSGSLR